MYRFIIEIKTNVIVLTHIVLFQGGVLLPLSRLGGKRHHRAGMGLP